MNSLQDDVLSDISSGDINFKSKTPQHPVLEKTVIFTSLF